MIVNQTTEIRVTSAEIVLSDRERSNLMKVDAFFKNLQDGFNYDDVLMNSVTGAIIEANELWRMRGIISDILEADEDSQIFKVTRKTK